LVGGNLSNMLLTLNRRPVCVGQKHENMPNISCCRPIVVVLMVAKEEAVVVDACIIGPLNNREGYRRHCHDTSLFQAPIKA
jgi:hypothetical protein